MSKFFWFSLCYIIGCSSAVLAADDSLWQRYNDEGKKALKDKDFPLAETNFQAALHRAEQFGNDEKAKAISYDHVADAKYLGGHYADAEPYYKKSIDCLQKCLEQSGQSTEEEKHKLKKMLYHQMSDLADCYRAEAKYADAEAIYRQVLAIDFGSDSEAQVKKATIQSQLGDILSLQGKYDEAERFYKTALPVFEKAGNEKLVLDLLEDYDALLRMTDRRAEADAMEDRIKNIHIVKSNG